MLSNTLKFYCYIAAPDPPSYRLSFNGKCAYFNELTKPKITRGKIEKFEVRNLKKLP